MNMGDSALTSISGVHPANAGLDSLAGRHFVQSRLIRKLAGLR